MGFCSEDEVEEVLPRCSQSIEGAGLTRPDASEQLLVCQSVRHLLLRSHAALDEQSGFDRIVPGSGQGIDVGDCSTRDVTTQSAAQPALQDQIVLYRAGLHALADRHQW